MRHEERISKLQINLSKKALEELEGLKKQMEASSKTEVVRSSLKLMKLIQSELSKGGEIVIKDAKGREKTIML